MLVAALAAAVLVAGGAVMHLRAEEAAKPLNLVQLMGALAAGHTVGAAKLVDTGQIQPADIGGKQDCSDELADFFASSGLMVNALSQQETDPATGMEAPYQPISVFAETRPTVEDATASYGAASTFTDCLKSKYTGTEGPSTSTYQTIYGSDVSWIVLVHRNVIAAVQFDEVPAGQQNAPIGSADRLVKDIDGLLDDAATA